MKFRIVAVTILIAVLASTVLSGCSFSGLDSTDLLRPPKGTGEKAYIESIINTRAGGDYILKYPKDGDYRSAIIMEDIDNDGTQEAIALYNPTAENTTTHILFMKKIDGVWTDIGDFEGYSNDIDKIALADVNGDDINEVVVSYLSAVPLANHMSIYFLEQNSVKMLDVEKEYNDFAVMHIEGEEKDNLLLMTLGAQVAEANASLMQYNEESDKIFVRSVVNMDQNVIQYALIQNGSVNDTTKGVFVDGTRSNNEIVSQVIYWDTFTNTLKNPLYNVDGKDELEINPTFRIGTTYCTDINDDGIIDIPTYSIMPLEGKEPLNMAVGLTQWNTLLTDEQELNPIIQTVVSSTDGYYFTIPEKWEDTVTARQDINSRSLTFYEWTYMGDSGLKGEELLTIKVFSIKDWNEQEGTKDFIEMEATTDLIYAVKTPSDSTSDLLLSLEEIKENLHLIE